MTRKRGRMPRGYWLSERWGSLCEERTEGSIRLGGRPPRNPPGKYRIVKTNGSADTATTTPKPSRLLSQSFQYEKRQPL